VGIFGKLKTSFSEEERLLLREELKKLYLNELVAFWIQSGTFAKSIDSLVPNQLTPESALFTLADLCRIHIERMGDSAEISTEKNLRKEVSRNLQVSKNLDESDVADLVLLYREIHSLEFPELHLVTPEFLESYEANPTDPTLVFRAGLYESLLFKSEFLKWAHMSSRSIFSLDVKSHFAQKEHERQGKKMDEYITNQFRNEKD